MLSALAISAGPVPPAFISLTLSTGTDFADRGFELGEKAQHVEERLAGRRRGSIGRWRNASARSKRAHQGRSAGGQGSRGAPVGKIPTRLRPVQPSIGLPAQLLDEHHRAHGLLEQGLHGRGDPSRRGDLVIEARRGTSLESLSPSPLRTAGLGGPPDRDRQPERAADLVGLMSRLVF
jgi:hypothetical protein